MIIGRLFFEKVVMVCKSRVVERWVEFVYVRKGSACAVLGMPYANKASGMVC